VPEALEILGSFGLVIANDGELLIVLLPAEAAEKTRVIIDENIIRPVASLKLALNSLYIGRNDNSIIQYPDYLLILISASLL
jgi:hypothetical protein